MKKNVATALIELQAAYDEQERAHAAETAALRSEVAGLAKMVDNLDQACYRNRKMLQELMDMLAAQEEL